MEGAQERQWPVSMTRYQRAATASSGTRPSHWMAQRPRGTNETPRKESSTLPWPCERNRVPRDRALGLSPGTGSSSRSRLGEWSCRSREREMLTIDDPAPAGASRVRRPSLTGTPPDYARSTDLISGTAYISCAPADCIYIRAPGFVLQLTRRQLQATAVECRVLYVTQGSRCQGDVVNRSRG